VTPTLGVLGIRHFVLDPSKSPFQVRIRGGLTVPAGNFQGQSNGQIESAFFDFEAGQPDADGFAKVKIIRASEYFVVDARTTPAQFVVCLHMLVPPEGIPDAGILGCNGGMDVSLSLDQDHRVRQDGIDVTADQCTALQGTVEVPYASCSAGLVDQSCNVDADCDTSTGAGDGACTHFPARCRGGNVGAVCQTDADCTTDTATGICGLPHGGVCNGPLVPGFGTGDTGPGEFLIAPIPTPPIQTNGLSIEIGFEKDLPCGDEGPGLLSPFALTTGLATSTISNADAIPGQTLTFQTQGVNFDCYNWQTSTRGRLVLSAPALDQILLQNPPTFSDVATVFNFASQ
jgi:hypothetical protein